MEKYVEFECVAKYHEDELVRKAAVAKMIEEIKTHSHRLGILMYYMKDGGFSEEARLLFGKEAVRLCVECGIYNHDDKNIKSIIADEEVPESVKEFARENLDATARKLMEELPGMEPNPYRPYYHSLIELYKDEDLSVGVREEAKTTAGNRIMENIDTLANEGRCWSLIKIKNDQELGLIHPEMAERAAGFVDKAAAKLIKAVNEGYAKSDYIGNMLQNLSDIIESDEISENVRDKAREIIGPVAQKVYDELSKNYSLIGLRSESLCNIVRMPAVPLSIRNDTANTVARFLANEAQNERGHPIHDGAGWIDSLERLATDETEPEVMRDAAGQQLARAFKERGSFGSLAAMIRDTYTIVVKTKDGQKERKTVKFTQPAKAAALEDIDYAAWFALATLKEEPERRLFEDEKTGKEMDDIDTLVRLTKNTCVPEKYRKEAGELLRVKIAGYAKGLDADVEELRKKHKDDVKAFGKKPDVPDKNPQPRDARRRLTG